MLARRMTLCNYGRRLYSTRRALSSDNLSKPVAADMIGIPDPVSNLRPVRYYISPNETNEEREWRLMQQRVDEYNQTFWSTNNAMFAKAKEEYENQLRLAGKEVTAEAMSVFYKDFLDKAYERQMEYNRTWWKLNTAMLYPGFKAAVRWAQSKRSQQANTKINFWEKSFES